MGKFGKILEDVAKKASEKFDKVDDALGKKVADVKETWDNVDPKTKKDIKHGAVGGVVGLGFGGLPGIAGLGYAAKKARDAYKREKEKKNYEK